MSDFSLDFAYQAGKPPSATAIFKAQPEDFQVYEELGFELPAEQKAEHHWLYIKKRGANTEFVARQLARFAEVPIKQVSYSGMKDRQAVTEQWFSVQLPATTEIDWNHLQNDEFSILQISRQGRKLRRGTHASNRFIIRLRDISDSAALEQALQRVAEKGVPNYFGVQRFGHGGANLSKAQAMFAGRRIKDRHMRSLLLSSARSYLFNHYLNQRMQLHGLDRLLAGDALLLSGTRSYFIADADNAEDTEQRLNSGDVELSGPLWGRGATPAQSDAADLESQLLDGFADFREGLEKAGLKQERRALLLRPQAFSWQWLEQDCIVYMRLPAGVYATSVLREVAELQEKASENITE
ncbi:tRNA pseudouridine(13) synthase TruD [Aliidiomarina minuta]|uniref:tRNA pseudouridine synthase D n=1 Tax=Aliidiomarina minuta TaxID=880057 RepID=A0A432W719_9GAMM|nr:tRNA pseudouridine(13) synthase TruD [Aliidiomarina minuta]RUO25811.1 tRNA pseudouridine(13) synthase TruD [Aliidiomarina minuta]